MTDRLDPTIRATLSSADLEQLERHGIEPEEARRQLELLAGPPPTMWLERPCGIGDGLVSLDGARQAELAELGTTAAREGRLAKFVPASGAASRMFKELMSEPLGADGQTDRFLDELERFPFFEDLRRAMKEAGHSGAAREKKTWVSMLLERPGLGYRSLPKGLLKFHRYPEGARTAFEEHLVEATQYVSDAEGVCRLHFTVSEEHRALFETLLEGLRGPLLERYGARFEVGFSVQSPATDTLAADLLNQPFRDAHGRLVLRPGGHGALILNLDQLRGDIVYIKNIDNVVRDSNKGPQSHWKRVLAGYLASLQTESFEILEGLEASSSPALLEAGLDFVATQLGLADVRRRVGADTDARREFLLDRLRRPMRVCGMVRNEGEPGGGPFWVADGQGEIRPQVVESAQVDGSDPAQREIFASGTHFNPVDLVCGMRDQHGDPYDLDSFVDPAAVFIAHKSMDGRQLKALERPGLWNGAMARWNTLFVEVPAATFAPVKTVFDLLRPAHQPRS